MVRFTPPIARLVTLALNSRLHQEGVPPASISVPTAVSNVPTGGDPVALAGAPTGYRDTRRESIRSMFGGKKMPPKEDEAGEYQYGVRTQEDPPVPAQEALAMLKAGNERFYGNKSEVEWNFGAKELKALATFGQRPIAAVLGCADSRAPLELLFDAKPGDVFVLRNAGNTLTNAKGSVVGSIEFAVNALGVKLVLVLGHTRCGALLGATQTMLNMQENGEADVETMLDQVLVGLTPVVEKAQEELKGSKDAAAIASEAVRVNVFAGMQKLLGYSPSVKEKVLSGDVELHGAVYDIKTGKVRFLGQLPKSVVESIEEEEDDD